MIKSFSVALAASVFACLFSIAPACAADREPVQAHVSRAGLDLSTSSGRTLLDRRIRTAAIRACAPRGVTMAAHIDSLRCRSEMIGDGSTQVAALRSAPGALASVAR